MSSARVLTRAALFAARAHEDQRRKGPSTRPYINHPLEVAALVAAGGFVTNAVCAALLHDVVEDTPVTLEQLRAAFGDDIAALVAEVTDDKALPWQRRKDLQILTAAQLSTNAKGIRIADKIANLRDLRTSPPDWSPERLARYHGWARQVVRACDLTWSPLWQIFWQEARADEPPG